MTMNRKTVTYFLFIFKVQCAVASFIFHENTRVMFTPEYGAPDSYFGYSIILRSNGLYVGAPKTVTTQERQRSSGVHTARRRYNNSPKVKMNETTGLVFTCSIENLNEKHIVCDRLGTKQVVQTGFYMGTDLKNDSWFGSSMAFLASDRLLISAPRLTSRFEYPNYGSLLQGACYVLTPRKTKILEPLSDGGRTSKHQGFLIEDATKEYGSAKVAIYYYSLGQVGFSVAVTKNNSVVLGAPGLLQFTGGIVSYTFNPNDTTAETNIQTIANPYYTKELSQDDYFGYSVESGIFEKNGTELYIGGAPRSELGRGKVILFKPPTDEKKPLDIMAKIIGPQVGSYFGSSLCCTDINEDGLDDLLIGASTFVKKSDALPYDQGAVFIYMAKEVPSGFVLEESGYVSGSGIDGARFATAIADLGDIDGDGLRDIAIGAPWEDDGIGAVYIYLGDTKGLKTEYAQRIQPSGARGFGWSIAKGVDIDKNDCNDLAIGAFNSGTSYLYRCVPTMTVHTIIKASKFINLAQNGTNFKAQFCVSSPSIRFRTNVTANFIGKIIVDPEGNRSRIIGNSMYNITVTPRIEKCYVKAIHVNIAANLLKPMRLIFELEADELMKDDSTTFLTNAARLSSDSTLMSTFSLQINRDCGDDLICSPWFNITLEALDNPYVPGTNKTFGIRLTAHNTEEPAYGVHINISLPMHPIRIPRKCSCENLMMTCNISEPFLRNETVVYEIELEYNLNATEGVDLIVTTELIDRFHRNLTEENVKEIVLKVTPEASFKISGISMPNTTIIVPRDNLYTKENVSMIHYFQITNLGPSDWNNLTAYIRIPDRTNLTTHIVGCEEIQSLYKCMWVIPAKVTKQVSIPLQMDLSLEGTFLKENLTYNATTSLYIEVKQSKYTVEVTTVLILEPIFYFWYLIAFCILIGLIVLAFLIWIMYMCDFFSRPKYETMNPVNDNLVAKSSSQADENSPDSDAEEDSENLLNKDNCEVVLSVDSNRSSFHVKV